jgi:aspartate/methionine/tyrosine aminotransferase
MTELASAAPRTLTDWQMTGLNNTFSLADGHAHHRVHTEAQASLTPRLAHMLFDVEGPQGLFEQRFAHRFYELAGQTVPPDAELAFHYSASVSTDCAARALADTGVRRVGLITPTFDNIPMLLGRAGLDLVPLEERSFWTEASYRRDRLRGCDAVFLVVPNNPTGFEPEQTAFVDLVGMIAEHGLTLVVDSSFRFYSRLHLWDQYRVVAEAGPSLDAVFLEDTGKTWPTAELKVGLTCAFGALREPLRATTREVLLNVSPFTLQLLTELIAADGRARATTEVDPHSCQVIAQNRSELRRLIGGVDQVQVDSEASLVSVEWLRVPAGTATATCAWLERRGVSVAPGNLFYWDRPHNDEHLRVALARPPVYFEQAAARLVALLQSRYS